MAIQAYVTDSICDHFRSNLLNPGLTLWIYRSGGKSTEYVNEDKTCEMEKYSKIDMWWHEQDKIKPAKKKDLKQS